MKELRDAVESRNVSLLEVSIVSPINDLFIFISSCLSREP